METAEHPRILTTTTNATEPNGSSVPIWGGFTQTIIVIFTIETPYLLVSRCTSDPLGKLCQSLNTEHGILAVRAKIPKKAPPPLRPKYILVAWAYRLLNPKLSSPHRSLKVALKGSL